MPSRAAAACRHRQKAREHGAAMVHGEAGGDEGMVVTNTKGYKERRDGMYRDTKAVSHRGRF